MPFCLHLLCFAFKLKLVDQTLHSNYRCFPQERRT
ncbi:unnamed protein product, partial [Linum tenue]